MSPEKSKTNNLNLRALKTKEAKIEKSVEAESKKILKYAGFFEKYFLKYFLISLGALLVLLFIILWLTGVFSFCGDLYCSGKECNSGCKDCDSDSCVDQTCQPQVGENCKNSQDCVCEINEVCGVERNNSKSNGCYVMKCGDGFCDVKGENKNNCCLDCGCEAGYSCSKQKNECVFQIPELGLTANSLLAGVSASSLYSNRELIDDNGKKHPLLSLKIFNSGTNLAKDVKLALKIGQYTEEQKENIGDIESGKSKDYEWYPTPTENMLNIMDDTSVLISVVASFEDEHGKRYTSTESIPLTIVGRSNWGTYSSFSQFVTPIDGVVRMAVSAAGTFSTLDDQGVQNAARQIWDFLRGQNIDYISDPTMEYRQYPAEVLQRKKGDCDDLATMYVGLLESVGIKTALITHPGHMYAAYYDSKYINPIETTMLTSSFEEAYNYGLKEYNEHEKDRTITKVEDEWKNKNLKTPGFVGINTNEVEFPNIIVHLAHSSEWVCTSQGQYGCQQYGIAVYCDLTFENTGTGEGQKCVNVYTYVDERSVQSKVACEKVGPKDNSDTRVTYIGAHANTAYNYRCEVK
ncbi:MAG: transglutaminase-like domain-containing protein [Candidatus Woesearchaeota archaeon]